MKKILIFFLIIVIQLSVLSGQVIYYADPAVSILMTPSILSLNALGQMNVVAGNFGNDAMIMNSLEVKITVGSNAEIIGLANNPNNDARWTIASLSSGIGNTIILHNTGGGFSSFDVGVTNLSIRGLVVSGAELVSASISYINANNPALGGLPNSSQGEAIATNNFSQTAVIVNSSTEDCLNLTDDDADGYIDCEDGDCSISGFDGTISLSVAPLSAFICEGDTVVLESMIINLPLFHHTIMYSWSSVNPDVIVNDYNAQNITVQERGDYFLEIGNLMGCRLFSDTIHVTVTTIDPTVTQSSSTLTVSMPDAEYQWVNCNNITQPIAGATNQEFTPSENGSYAVIVTKDGCSETSQCMMVNTVGTTSVEKENGVTVYPNPFAAELIVSFETAQSNTQVNVIGMDGKLISTQFVSGTNAVLKTEVLAKGMYMVQLIDAEASTALKVVKY